MERDNLLKNTKSICPKCNKILTAVIYEKDGKAMIKKTCDVDGEFEDIYQLDVNMYSNAEDWIFDGKGLDNPKIKDAKNCPESCGLCNLHLTHTLLGLIDLTNNCQLECPDCFANISRRKYVYEPSFEQVVKMMKELRAEKPVHCSSIQFSGGEPTLHPDFFKIIQKAKELGFSHIQVATNGLKMKELEFCQKMVDAGVHTIYLQFDGFEKTTYQRLRGEDISEIKKRAIENCRKTNPSLAVVLVPTICKNLNDKEVGKIINYAVKNFDVVRGVIFQPIAFTGRGFKDKKMVIAERYTLSDLVRDIEQQTSFLKKEDFYPISSVVPISDFYSSLTEKPELTFSVHPHCGVATILFKKNDNVVPITRIINVEGILLDLIKKKKSKKFKIFVTLRKKFRRFLPIGGRGFFGYFKAPYIKILFSKFFINRKKYPKSFYSDLEEFADDILKEKSKSPLSKIFWNSLLIGGMHFQDSYNFDIERVKRCGIHYATPDGRIIPFCTYNSGPTYREQIEQRFSVPLNKWNASKNIK